MRQFVDDDLLVESPSRSGLGPVKMYICMRPEVPSGGVPKLALFVPEKSCASGQTKSLPNPPRPKLSSWKFRAASVNPSS